MTYRPYTKEDKLEVGTKIRLGGRDGEIVMTNEEHPALKQLVEWTDSNYTMWLNLPMCTFEIEDMPLPPLKIDKRVKEKLMLILQRAGIEHMKCHDAVECLNSLEEV